MSNSFSAAVKIVSDVESKEVKGFQLATCRGVHTSSYKEGSDVFMGLNFWGNKASAATKALAKGDSIFVIRGNLEFRQYQEKTYMDLNVDDFVKFQGTNKSSQSKVKSDAPSKKGEKTAPVGVDVEEDIPF